MSRASNFCKSWGSLSFTYVVSMISSISNTLYTGQLEELLPGIRGKCKPGLQGCLTLPSWGREKQPGSLANRRAPSVDGKGNAQRGSQLQFWGPEIAKLRLTGSICNAGGPEAGEGRNPV